MVASDHCERARAYAADVTAGRVTACRWVKLACERQLRDLEREASSDFPYQFDTAAAERVCRFVESFGHVKGAWARTGERLKLEPWQAFILASVFGWRHAENGGRRFKTIYIEIARKNAKSTLASALGLYLLAADGEPGAVVVSAATTRDQARLCFADAQALARNERGFRQAFRVEVRAHAIVQLHSGSTFQALSAEGSHQDGLNVSAAIIDELHAHRDRKIWDVIDSATGARLSPIIWAITTAGHNQTGICYEQRAYLTKLLEGTVSDESYWGLIYTLDPEDDWKDPSVWVKANPNLGVSIYPKDLEQAARKAAQTPTALTPFLTKRLNVWVNAATQWLDPAAWAACRGPGLRLEDFAGEPCYAGLDLAFKSDLAALALWFPECPRHPHTVFFRFFTNRAALEREENAILEPWARRGYLTVYEGKVTDWEAMADELDELGRRYAIEEIACDPWQLPAFFSILNRRSLEVPMVEVRQITQNFSPAMKELEALILNRQLAHDGNPVMHWMVSNVVCKYDENDNIRPRKAERSQKIDGVIALLLAGDRVLRIYGAPSPYATRDLVTVPVLGPGGPPRPGSDYFEGLEA